MSDIKFIQVETVLDKDGYLKCFALDNAGVIWRLDDVLGRDANGNLSFSEKRQVWFALPSHPANSARRDG